MLEAVCYVNYLAEFWMRERGFEVSWKRLCACYYKVRFLCGDRHYFSCLSYWYKMLDQYLYNSIKLQEEMWCQYHSTNRVLTALESLPSSTVLLQRSS